MKILLINHYAGSPMHGMEFRPYYLAREWVRSGHQVQIAAASYSHIRSRQPQLEGNQIEDEIIDGIYYHWYPTPGYTGNGIGRVRNMLSFIRQLRRDTKALANGFKPDVVIASSTYPMDIWPAERIARLAGARLVYEVHDLWPLSPVELGGMSRWHPFIMWVQWAEDHAYKRADCVVSILPKTLDYMVSRGLAPEKWAYVPNGVDLAEWRSPADLPADIHNALQKIKARSLPIVGYVGTHGLANALDVLLDAAALLKGQTEVLLVGTGPERERLQQRVGNEGLDNVTMLPSIPKTAIPQLLAQIDIAYIGLLAEPLFRFGISPNKLFDYMMAGKPVVQSIAAGNDLVTEVGCGLTVPPANAAQIAKAIRHIADLDEHARQQLGLKGQQFVMRKRLYSTLAQDFLNAVSDMKTRTTDKALQ